MTLTRRGHVLPSVTTDSCDDSCPEPDWPGHHCARGRCRQYAWRVASRLCWYCGTRAHMTRLTAPIAIDSLGEFVTYQAPYKCDECGRGSVGIAQSRGSASNPDRWIDNHAELVWHPAAAAGKDFPDVPEHIGSTADEAHRCLSIGAHRGAIALARAVVEATAKAHGITSGNLEMKIEKLADQRVISDAMKDAAHEIRFAGNEVAHGDLAEEPITREDAEEVLELMEAMLKRVYEEPAQVARVRQRREERTKP